MTMFLNHKDGQTYQSIPVCAFFTADFEYLCHFTEYAAIYDKERVVVQHIRAPDPANRPRPPASVVTESSASCSTAVFPDMGLGDRR